MAPASDRPDTILRGQPSRPEEQTRSSGATGPHPPALCRGGHRRSMPKEVPPAPKVIGDLSIYPIGQGTSLGAYVRTALQAMRGCRGVRLIPGAMSTVIEANSLAEMLEAVTKAHEALIRMGAQRIAIHLRVDHRLDKAETVEYKVDRVTSPP